jgi:hypothetical protein
MSTITTARIGRYSDRLRDRRPGLDSRQRKIFYFTTSPGVKRQGREANHSPPSNAVTQNGGVVTPLTHIWHSA